jgi:hypothetical protein
MAEQEKMQTKGLRSFFPDARCLSGAEIAQLLPEKKKLAEASGKKGAWMEVFCPDDSCLNKDGHIVLPIRGTESEGKKGFWLNLFCPEDECVIEEGTRLP